MICVIRFDGWMFHTFFSIPQKEGKKGKKVLDYSSTQDSFKNALSYQLGILTRELVEKNPDFCGATYYSFHLIKPELHQEKHPKTLEITQSINEIGTYFYCATENVNDKIEHRGNSFDLFQLVNSFIESKEYGKIIIRLYPIPPRTLDTLMHLYKRKFGKEFSKGLRANPS